MREWSPETENMEFHIPAILYGNRNLTVKNSPEHSSSNGLPPPLPILDLPESENFQKTGRKTASFQDHCVQVVLHWEMHKMHQMHQFNVSQQEKTLGNQPRSIVANYTYKDTIATWISGFPMEIVELWTLHLFRCDMNWEHHRHLAFTIEIWQYMYLSNFSN